MSFRTVVIKSRCKLSYSLNNLIYRGDEDVQINIDEISTLIIQSMEVSITSSLISKLMDRKVKILFCDSYSNPQGEVIPYYASYNVHDKIEAQINIAKHSAENVWQEIIRSKIFNQKLNLQYKSLAQSEKLGEYIFDVLPGDVSNREGHAAKVYFNALFGNSFSRDDSANETNVFLNYGYSIILSAINREIKSIGYLTEIGIHHIGSTNPFNLSCDFMEPLRPLIDFYVISGKVCLDNFKREFINVLNLNVFIDGKNMILDNAIKLYIQSLFNALLDDDSGKIKFIEYERL